MITMEKKDVLIINHQNFSNIGGIEVWLYNLTKYCVENQIRVIWLCDKKPLIHSLFRSVMLNNQVERVVVNCRKLNWFKIGNIKLFKNERYVVFSANPINMCASEDLMLHHKGYDFFPIYAIPDTTGNSYFLERNFRHKIVQNYVFKYLQKTLSRWMGFNAIRYFSASHSSALSGNYGIVDWRTDRHLLKPLNKPLPINLLYLQKKAHQRNPFVISTVGRFDYPHKGYMLGLVRSFGTLKKEFPQIELRIAGFGPHESLLQKEINKLPKQSRESVKIIGAISPDALDEFNKTSHLCINVAGAASKSARVGTLTLVGRNYCDKECEVYGFFHECAEKTTSLEKGLSVEPFIRQVLNMGEEEYIDMCKKDYNVVADSINKNYNPLYLFETTRNDRFIPSRKEIVKMKVVKRLITLNHYLKFI